MLYYKVKPSPCRPARGAGRPRRLSRRKAAPGREETALGPRGPCFSAGKRHSAQASALSSRGQFARRAAEITRARRAGLRL